MANIETSTDASRVIYLDSADASENLSGITTAGKSKKTTDVKFFLEEAVVVPPHHTILLSLHSCAIPYSFYNFQTGRNTQLKIQFVQSNTLSTPLAHPDENAVFTLTINQGNYNIASLLDQVKSFVNLASSGLVGGSNTDFDCAFNPSTLKCEWLYKKSNTRLRFLFRDNQDTNFKEEFGFNENCFVQPEIDGGYNFWMENDGDGTGGDPNLFQIGFDNGGTATPNFTAITNTGVGGSPLLMSDPDQFFSVVDVNFHIRSLYLRTNITQHSVLDSSIGSRFSNILARIPINSQSGGELVVAPSDGAVHQLILKVREITSISIRLTDKENKLIDLNGLDFQVALQFDFIETPQVSVPVSMREKVEAKKIHKFLKDTGREKELKEFVADERNKKFLNV